MVHEQVKLGAVKIASVDHAVAIRARESHASSTCCWNPSLDAEETNRPTLVASSNCARAADAAVVEDTHSTLVAEDNPVEVAEDTNLVPKRGMEVAEVHLGGRKVHQREVRQGTEACVDTSDSRPCRTVVDTTAAAAWCDVHRGENLGVSFAAIFAHASSFVHRPKTSIHHEVESPR